MFSNGPYKLEGKWDVDKGGTFVRNPEWDATTDTSARRSRTSSSSPGASSTEVIADRLIADSGYDQNAITTGNVPPAYYSQITGDGRGPRGQLVDSPFVDYLLPNFNRMTNPKVRQALAAATDRDGYVERARWRQGIRPGDCRS